MATSQRKNPGGLDLSGKAVNAQPVSTEPQSKPGNTQPANTEPQSKAGNYEPQSITRKNTILEQDSELIQINMRMEDHLAQIAHEIEALSRRNYGAGSRNADSQEAMAWPFFAKCTR